MTITESDRDRYDSVVSQFVPQHDPTMCFTSALKNILGELAERHDVPGLAISLRQLNDIFDFREMLASSTREIPAKLNPEINPYGYDTRVVSGIDLEDLQAVIDDPKRSYPIVDLAPSYFDSVTGYDPRAGPDGYQWSHVVIPFKVNHERILFYDPFGEIFVRSSKVDTPPSERSQSAFFEWWSAPVMRWTMWIQRQGQRTLTSPEFTGEDNGGD